MTAFDRAEFEQHIELLADAAALPSIRDNLAAGHDWREGQRIIAHRAEVERVRASETRETGTDAHQCYPRIIPGSRRVA